ncbi:hypothetical protein QJS10_CPB21g01110 [Acorus calamus]|uniref:GIR1-like zinc ribbon domain-containing protein n=1 Tax=Acorus calamus TaxID=4465 RepID=A0AAV9C491_ACOCL|nr:hypothetical protein QJS10_CPB21g01110 [Acorus calamus]
MAADVSALFRILNGYSSRDDGGGAVDTAEAPKRFLVTRDLLGECARRPHKELDLDIRVPIGWEKRLDLQSGKVYIQKSSAPSIPDLTRPSLHDLNFPPKPTAQILPSTSLDLRLSPSASSDYQSVHTLEKVKSALERAHKKRPSPLTSTATATTSSSISSSTTTTTTTSSEPLMRGEEDRSGPSDQMFAAGCPGCLMYVLISSRNPKCPRCASVVPSPATAKAVKKPRLDLNMTA